LLSKGLRATSLLRFVLTRQKGVSSFDFFTELLVVHNRSEWWESVDGVCNFNAFPDWRKNHFITARCQKMTSNSKKATQIGPFHSFVVVFVLLAQANTDCPRTWRRRGPLIKGRD
jgi:hypothetical protein